MSKVTRGARMKGLGILLAVATLATPSAALAETGSSGPSRAVSATASVGHARSFSLRAAHRAASRLERNWHVPLRLGKCRWVTPHKAACRVVLGPATIVTGGAPMTFAWTDFVIRPLWAPAGLFAWAAGLHQIS